MIDLRTERALRTLSRCSRALFHARVETDLAFHICRIIVEHGYTMAWIGYAEHDAESTVRVAGYHGYEDGYLERAHISWADNERGRGPTGMAIRTGRPAACRDFLTDPAVAPWREDALKRGYRASLVLPLLLDGEAMGALSVYAADVGAFDIEEVELLEELAAEFAWGVASLREREARQNVEKALVASEARLRCLTENLRESVWLFEVGTGKVLYVSRAYERLWGRTCESLYRDPASWFEAIHPEDGPHVREAARALRTTGAFDVEYRVVRPDGETSWIHDRGFPVLDAEGHLERVAGVAEDITARRRLEEHLRASQRMDAIGRLASGIAHDFNNILTAVVLQSELAMHGASVSKELHRDLEQIVSSAERGAGLTRQLLQFSRQQILRPRVIDLNEVIRGIAPILERLLPADLRLDLALDPLPCAVRADPSMLEQVVLNLVVNARDAMPLGGVIDVVTGRTTVLGDAGGTTEALAPGEYVLVRVSDRGTGIPDDALARIFDPFFTTKSAGQGTGLGLSTVLSIVQQHQGAVGVSTEAGLGTTFRVLLPASESVATERVVRSSARPPGGVETILLAEYDADLRAATRGALERAGYRVISVANGVEALTAWSNRDRRIHLLATEQVMPLGVGASELATLLRARDPALKVLTFSGFIADGSGLESDLGPGTRYLQKPFSTADLLQAVRETLDDFRPSVPERLDAPR